MGFNSGFKGLMQTKTNAKKVKDMRSDVILINCKAPCCCGRNSKSLGGFCIPLALHQKKTGNVSEKHELKKPIKHL